MLRKLTEIHLSLVNEVRKISYSRYLYDKVNWKSRLIGIAGARGTGKTTLLLQYYCKNFDTPEDCLYLSADNINVISYGLLSIAEEFFSLGGNTLLVDEVHKYPLWQQELKNIYDSFPGKQVIFSGSSSSHILKGGADLSRRTVLYLLKGLSFREYLLLTANTDFAILSLNSILKNHMQIAAGITSKIPVLRYFKNYLKSGYYPFFLEGKDEYFNRLDNVVEKIISEDIPSLYNIKYSTIHSLKKLLYLVATSQPFIPNISAMSSQLKISKEYIYAYIDEMQKSGLFSLLFSGKKGLTLVRKPEKIYLENTNLFSLIEETRGFSVERGSIRETFFLNQVQNVTDIYYTDKADFIDSKSNYYEIGGKNKTVNKTNSRLRSSQNYCIVRDDIVTGHKNIIPLWLFGFLY